MYQIKKLLGMIVAIAFVVVACILGFSNSVEHIEDTNGENDYSLQVITDKNIETLDFGSKGFSETTNNVTNERYFSSKKFTGVADVFEVTSLGSSCTVYVNYFDVRGGNIKLVVVKDGKIVHEFKPNEVAQQFTVENVKGSSVALRIAGESASFKLSCD